MQGFDIEVDQMYMSNDSSKQKDRRKSPAICLEGVCIRLVGLPMGYWMPA